MVLKLSIIGYVIDDIFEKAFEAVKLVDEYTSRVDSESEAVITVQPALITTIVKDIIDKAIEDIARSSKNSDNWLQGTRDQNSKENSQSQNFQNCV